MAAPVTHRVNTVDGGIVAWRREVGGLQFQGRTGLLSPGSIPPSSLMWTAPPRQRSIEATLPRFLSSPDAPDAFSRRSNVAAAPDRATRRIVEWAWLASAYIAEAARG